jgi:transcriptional regulator NrdR family protein
MNCPKCNHTVNRVADTAQSSKSYVINRGKYYLWQWGLRKSVTLPRTHDAFVARQRKCMRCNYNFRTVETIQS